MDVVTVGLRFTIDTSLGPFSDTLYFSEDEWAKRDGAAIKKRKQSLADAWVVFMTQQLADAAELATAEGKQNKIAEIDARIAQLADEKAALVK